MINILKKYYYKISNIPFIDKIIIYFSPIIKKVINKFDRFITLRTQIKNLEQCQKDQRRQINYVISMLPDYRKNCPKISIVINTCNRAKELVFALNSLLHQVYPDFEIIVVNGPSTDNTANLLEKFSAQIKILSCDEYNLSKSRNIGISAASGQIIAFLDDDAIASTDWLMELSRGFHDESVAAVGGFIHDYTGIDWQSRICVADRFGDVRHYYNMEECIRKEGMPEMWGSDKFFSPTGTNVGFRREALVAIGGFDENYAWHLDETDVLLRLHDAGYKIRYTPYAEVTHKLAPSQVRKIDNIPKSLYQQAKSKAYFITRYAVPAYGKEDAKKHLLKYSSWLLANIKYLKRKGRLNNDDYQRLSSEIEKGIQKGQELANSSKI